MKSRESTTVKRAQHLIQLERSVDQIMTLIVRMKNSNEFADIFKKTCVVLSELGMQSKVYDLIIFHRNTGAAQVWTYGQILDEEYQFWLFSLPKLKSKHYLESLEAWRKKRKLRQTHLKGNLAQGYYRQILNLATKNSLPETAAIGFSQLDPAYHTEYFIRYGLLRVVTESPLNRDEERMLKRFSRVLEHAYTRFLDLKEKEALYREKEIEGTLEKVRARTTAMTESAELSGTVELLYQQLLDLGIGAERIVICFPNEKKGIAEFWMTGVSGSRIEHKVTIELDGPSAIRKVLKAWKKQIKSTVFEISGQELKSYLHFMVKSFGSAIPVPSDKEKRIFSIANFSHGFINVVSTSPLSPNDVLLLERFAAVLEQIYTRFLDLKKAEEQARKAQIEAALERVRSRTMAMHKSDELNEVITMIFKELRALNIFIHGAMVYLFDDPGKGFNLWLQDSVFSFVKIVHFTPIDHPFFNSLIRAEHSKESIITDLLDKEEKDRLFRFLLEHSDLRHVRADRKEFVLTKPGYSRSIAATKHAAMAIDNFDRIVYTPEENNILLRFAHVFDQTYTRFLDLKKAEKQAREARIEAALERVRSRSMAMQRSSELADVSEILFRELRNLGSHVWACGIVLCDEGKDVSEHWMSVEDGKLSRVQVPVDLDHIHRSMYNAWLDKKQLFTLEIDGDDLIRHYEQMKTIPVLRENIDQATQKQFKAPKWQKNYVASFGYGYLLVVTIKESKQIDIYPRFAKVFEQCYTRFLDLKKAEAQAREAQIETALERVRSASMAMQASEEMPSVAFELFQQLFKLGLCIDAITIDIPEPGVNDLVVWGATSDYHYDFSIRVPYIEYAILKTYRDAIENRFEFFSDHFDKQEKNQFLQHVIDQTPREESDEELRTRFQSILDADSYDRSVAIQYLQKEQSVSEGTSLQIVSLWMANYQGHQYVETENEILRRFSVVFSQSYTRFLDLKKAEAQAREAQIEAALERVRSRTLAMHRSEELVEIVQITYRELLGLNLLMDGLGIDVFEDHSGDFRIWSATPQHNYPTELYIPYIDTPIMNRVLEARQNKETVFVDHIPKEEIRAYYRHCLTNTVMRDIISEERKNKILQSKGFDRVMSIAEHTGLFIFNFQLQKYTQGDIQVVRRFGQVFEQSYIRFLDLQKAEAQAREAQIEAALERVRSRSMAMHKSSEIGQVVVLIYDELRILGFPHYMNCGYIEIDEKQNVQQAWMTNMGADFEEKFTLPLTGDPILDDRYENWKQKKPFFHQEVGGQELRDHIEFVLPQMHSTEWEAITTQDLPDPTHFNNANFSHGYLQLETDTALGQEDISLLIRFAQVFEQTYTRFLDLQKAELQAREAQIETAMERIRARAMAMHNSEELSQTSQVFYEQCEKLGLKTRCTGFAVPSDRDLEICSIFRSSSGEMTLQKGIFLADRYQLFADIMDQWERNQQVIKRELGVKDLQSLNAVVGDVMTLPEKFSELVSETGSVHHHLYRFSHGYLFATSRHCFLEEEDALMGRFAQAFDLAYTRYEDLLKAEEQARESQVEAALERVRAKAMSMQSSADLNSTVSVLLAELQSLDIHPIRCGLGRVRPDQRIGDIYVSTVSDENNDLELIGSIPMDNHPVLKAIFKAYEDQREYYPILQDDLLTSYYAALSPFIDLEEPPPGTVQFGYYGFYKEFGLYAWANSSFDNDSISTYRKFTNVLGLTCQRFQNLLDSEARALKALREASLDRVRAEIASMRDTSDLQRITPLLWQELTTLEVPFVRCGVFIVDDEAKRIESYLSNPQGESLAAWRSDYETIPLFAQLVQAWKNQEIYQTEWNKAQFHEFSQVLIDNGLIEDRERYQAGKEAPDYLHLYMIPFKQGMLYVGSTVDLDHDQIELVQALANSFSVAYSRYEDFRQLEKAKRNVEQTLTELQEAQTLLIHSEKMASLGELTAGIAHEIQNPLNFVNNFSEVSSEILEEMREALENRNIQEVQIILSDLKENLQKIHHHGDRASSIVKGMLDHSRASTTEKVMTDINKLCEEYTQLAYHGLRAKNKKFQSNYDLDLDADLPQIKVVAQDIGRVILNLLNNAFYTVHRKKEMNPSTDYQPHVKLTTSAVNGGIQIQVSDNGEGMTEDVSEKIFQPFFTTKPTGMGTGLGLSLAYDIVTNGHQGQLVVETKKGKGTTFIIQLPNQ